MPLTLVGKLQEQIKATVLGMLPEDKPEELKTTVATEANRLAFIDWMKEQPKDMKKTWAQLQALLPERLREALAAHSQVCSSVLNLA